MRRIYEDLLRSQSQLMQSDKLATIGLLSAGIAHEINNPLSAVKLAFSLLGTQMNNLKKRLGGAALADADAQKLLKAIEEYIQQGQHCAEAMSRIVTDIRTFSRSDKGVSNPEDIHKIIDSVINIVWNAVKNKVKIDKQYGELPLIRCNAQQLGQVFLNLLVNASQAMDQNGVITLRTFGDGKNVFVQISDTGCGMTKEVMDRIFEAFFTTKGAADGTGLGLSITRDIIKKHNGEITVESTVGKGTTFTISLPV
jgi:two-component system NtrC family sensor kinase